ncbi:LysR family transcriptional regulator [Kitasatospora sp. NPDC056181]|uniref:LysR family transcriptional regulator n=1 Tax=Kitasatospora sp. NPDC056181 TaxID=3345737 RepID=UPI0035D65D98
MMLRGLELREVECFLVLGDELHFGRAAERLGLSRARVTQLIQALERRVGGRLVQRTSRRVSLTPAGEQLAADWTAAYRALDAGLQQAAALARGIPGRLAVRYAATVSYSLVNAWLDQVRQRRPGCRISVEACPVADVFASLRDGRADAVVTRLPPGGPELLAWHEPDLRAGAVLARDAPVLLVPADHPLAGAAHLEAEELSGLVLWEAPAGLPEWFRRAWTPALTPAGRAIGRRSGAASVEDLLAGTAAGHALHLTFPQLLDQLPHPGLRAVPVRGLPPFLTAVVRPGGTGGAVPADPAVPDPVLADPAATVPVSADPVLAAAAGDHSPPLNGPAAEGS